MQKNQLDQAVAEGIISGEQAERLMERFASPATETGTQRFDFAHMLWYFGALIIISGMGLFSSLAFSQLGAPALLATAIIYGAVFLAAGNKLWHRDGLRTPGGLLITVAVSMMPLGIYALQDMAGWWAGSSHPGAYQGFFKWIKGGFIPMELGTILAALLALRFYRFPFLMFIIAVMVWFLSMDVADWLRGIDGWSSFQLRRTVSLVFGLVLIPIAWFVDMKRKDQDFGFWLHLVGIITFWGALSMTSSSSHMAKLMYCLLNVGLIGFAVFMSRRVYAVFGGLGVMIYFGDLAYSVFKDWLFFPFMMTLLGLGVIGMGLLYHRHADRIAAAFERIFPPALLRLRPTVRG